MKPQRFQKHAVRAAFFPALLAIVAGCGSNSAAPLPAVNGATPGGPAQSAGVAVGPARKPCKPVLYTGVGWQYLGNNMTGEWYEWSGPWTRGAYETLVPCAGDPMLWSGQPLKGQPLNAWWGTIAQASAWRGSQAKAVTEPLAQSVAILKTGARKTVMLETISTAPNAPADVAVGKDGTMYVLVVPPPQNTNASSVILVYPKGQTRPSRTMIDQRVGKSPGAIAVDSQNDLFVSFDAGVLAGEEIDEFANGNSNPSVFLQVSGAKAGSLAIDENGDLAVSSLRVNATGDVTVYNLQRMRLSSFATTPYPVAIALDRSGKKLTVVDSTENKVTAYAYPSGALQSQTSLGNSSQTWLPGGMIEP